MYTDDHKYFLQFMLQNTYISVGTALDFCNKHPIDDVKNESDIKEFISQINAKILQQELKISFLKCEVTGDVKLALLNTGNDEVSKLQTVLNSNELEYFQILLQELVVSEEHKLKKMACFNLNNSPRGMNIDSIENLLTTCERQGYLVEKDAYIHLGARCVVEFAPYFNMHCKNYYNDCYLCSEAVFVGSTCPSCDKTMHRHCMERYLNTQKRCPACKGAWSESRSNSQSLQQMDGSEESSEDDSQ